MSERLDVRRMLLRRGWTEDRGLGSLRKNGALWVVLNDCGDSGLDGLDRKYSVEFDSGVPARVIVGACEAAAGKAPHSPAEPVSPVPAVTEVTGGDGEAQGPSWLDDLTNASRAAYLAKHPQDRKLSDTDDDTKHGEAQEKRDG